jgi:hypothetical protein
MQFFSQGNTEVSHFRDISFAGVMNPLQHLLCAKFFLPNIQEKGFHLGERQPQQIDFSWRLLGSYLGSSDIVAQGF